MRWCRRTPALPLSGPQAHRFPPKRPEPLRWLQALLTHWSLWSPQAAARTSPSKEGWRLRRERVPSVWTCRRAVQSGKAASTRPGPQGTPPAVKSRAEGSGSAAGDHEALFGCLHGCTLWGGQVVLNQGLDPKAWHGHSRTSPWGTETAGQRPVLQGWGGVCQAGCPRYQGRRGCPEAGEGGRGQLSWGGLPVVRDCKDRGSGMAPGWAGERWSSRAWDMTVLEEQVTHPDERGLCLPGGCQRVTGPRTKDWALKTTEERWGAGSPYARPRADTEMS